MDARQQPFSAYLRDNLRHRRWGKELLSSPSLALLLLGGAMGIGLGIVFLDWRAAALGVGALAGTALMQVGFVYFDYSLERIGEDDPGRVAPADSEGDG
jgi:hypothetical protein